MNARNNKYVRELFLCKCICIVNVFIIKISKLSKVSRLTAPFDDFYQKIIVRQ